MALLYSRHSIRRLETFVFSEHWETEWGLMKKAGAAVFRSLCGHWPKARSIVVCAGQGNNGVDGLLVAYWAQQAGFQVQVFTVGLLESKRAVAKRALALCVQAGVTIQPYSDELPVEVDIIVDALLGTGLRDQLLEPYRSAILAINQIQKPVISVDVASGLDADTGAVTDIAVRSNVTVTLLGMKPGLLTGQGPSQSGQIISDHLGVPDCLFSKITPAAESLEWSALRTHLPPRPRDAHKGHFGHVLVIGGDNGMGGAACMAAEAALRVGAGRLSVATRPEHVAAIIARRPEIMCYSISSREDLMPLIEKASVLLIGSGLGKSDWARVLLESVLHCRQPMVLDADALNLLSESPCTSDRWILTPHPAEAGRLLSQSSSEIQANRFSSVKALQKRYGGVVVLKGAGSLIQSMNAVTYLCPRGNPGMASAGMGDVLGGVIAGLMAQGFSLTMAAKLGVMVHALSGDDSAQIQGERGVLASDLMLHLQRRVNPTEGSD